MSFLSKISAPFRRSAPTASLALPPGAIDERLAGKPRGGGDAVMADLPIYQQLLRIGGALTPIQVSEIMRMADQGQMYRLMDLANEARQKDNHLQSVLETRELAISCLPWQLVLPENANRKEKKAAAVIEAALRRDNCIAPLLAHCAGAAYYGYAVTETLFTKRDGYIVPESFKPRAPRRFVFDLEHGALRWCDVTAGMTLPGVDLRETYPGQFVVAQPRINGDVPCREGLVRPLMWAALFRNWALTDWVKLGEIAWKPWRTGTYKAGAPQEDIDNLYTILQGLTASGVAAHPDDTTIKIEWPPNASNKSTHSDFFTVIAAEMSKAVLGQTLTTEVGSTGGNRALGQVMNGIRMDRRDGDARSIETDVSRDLISHLTRWNWGPDVRPSQFHLITEDVEDIATFATGVAAFSSAGLRMPASWLRAQVGMPDPEDEEETVGGITVEEEPEPGPDGPEPKPEETDDGSEKEDVDQAAE